MKKILLLLLCLLFMEQAAFSQNKKKSAGQDALLFRKWKLVNVDIPGTGKKPPAMEEMGGFMVDLSSGKYFVVSAAKMVVKDKFFITETDGERYIIASVLSLKIKKVSPDLLVLTASLPMPEVNKITLTFIAADADAFSFPREMLAQSWAIESRNEENPPKNFAIELNDNGSYRMLEDTTVSTGTWTVSRKDLQIKLTSKNNKTQTWVIKSIISREMAFAPGYNMDSTITLSKSYKTMDEIVDAARSKGDFHAYVNSKRPGTVYDSAYTAPTVEEVPTNTINNEPVAFVNVGQKPEFPGGDAAFYKYLSDNIHYPETAKQNGVMGRVYVSFTINKDGSVSDVKVLKGIGSGCDDEAVRVIKSMPNWKPGRQNGKAVQVEHTLPVIFKL